MRRIGQVCTRKEHRKNGYAKCLTAFVAGKILKDGARAFLFAGKDEVVPNKVYDSIGFE